MIKKDPKNMFAELAKIKDESSLKESKLEVETNDSSLDLGEEMEGSLTVDVYKTENEIVVQSTVAGVGPDDLEVNITNESVTIHGKREKMEKIEDKDYFYQECFWGKFSRSIILPEEVDPEKSTAVLKNGILIIRMPKLNRQKAKKINVKLA
ncbi:hypothetical protein COY65_01145 [Candidatus Jorgensenbacteria bacterium CG_4_10_14_0_8_um_filter_39_13]|uniref:SHSP domain-containing protein n=2 Tax=Candidatus Joergenseniibacteriota TaxID=1752739 RepID=A0A2M7RHL3_9BACT|nr:MAG: hypothetical protein COV54_01190 [Candidatus Jorgensenbacteria bacterium CG11_big_fil_rev_8_21_14_0_20_38_23]PIV13221.1 MAG: hypothetical protein COS46_01305 [Candidatus Jorgensenbacteria bacterium CG03_land_8_20_14_0_80_38_39]PIW97876.1 MAG: hypothetical protein COZ81_00310 [Candidatus Jorgensenbacteria bacterium CG_4_8_14_3_um_filter_38_10]PIY96228.1 MAG: hypothetical protein COY65_01145 [Candidatus Jorgensenbacteria bacterium CG_4_10_14_0_8_um_filter_39_13]PJA95012.1 MAG: hypothetica